MNVANCTTSGRNGNSSQQPHVKPMQVVFRRTVSRRSFRPALIAMLVVSAGLHSQAVVETDGLELMKAELQQVADLSAVFVVNAGMVVECANYRQAHCQGCGTAERPAGGIGYRKPEPTATSLTSLPVS